MLTGKCPALTGLLAVTLLVSTAAADLMRPVTPGDNTLQELLDSLVVAGPGFDAVNDQQNQAYFASSASGLSLSCLAADPAVPVDPIEFVLGIYAIDNPDIRAVLFDASSQGGDMSVVSFRADASVSINFGPAVANLGSRFGFFLTADQQTWFSDDTLNPNNQAAVLIYQGDPANTLQMPGLRPGRMTPYDFIIAFESGDNQSFADMVIVAESISLVPEPATVMFLAAGLACVRRLGGRRI